MITTFHRQIKFVFEIDIQSTEFVIILTDDA